MVCFFTRLFCHVRDMQRGKGPRGLPLRLDPLAAHSLLHSAISYDFDSTDAWKPFSTAQHPSLLIIVTAAFPVEPLHPAHNAGFNLFG